MHKVSTRGWPCPVKYGPITAREQMGQPEGGWHVPARTRRPPASLPAFILTQHT